jgi:hypothetical protein
MYDVVPSVAGMVVTLLECKPDPERRATILRLADDDPRMERVWVELSKARVSPPTVWAMWLKFFGTMGKHPPDPEGMAAALFFYQAFVLSLLVSRPRAEQLSTRGEAYRRAGQWADVIDGAAPPDAIPGLPLILNLLDTGVVGIRRHRGNFPERYYAARLARTTRKLYGQVLLTTIGTTTCVALDLKHEIPRATVQYWTSPGV